MSRETSIAHPEQIPNEVAPTYKDTKVRINQIRATKVLRRAFQAILFAKGPIVLCTHRPVVEEPIRSEAIISVLQRDRGAGALTDETYLQT